MAWGSWANISAAGTPRPSGFGFTLRVEGLGFRLWGFGFRVEGLGLRVEG